MTNTTPLQERLTPRQKQVLKLMVDGRSIAEIGAVLDITSRTAKYHVSEIYKRLGVNKYTQAVTLAIREGLVPLPAREPEVRTIDEVDDCD